MKRFFLYVIMCVMPLASVGASEQQVEKFAERLADDAIVILKNEELSKTGKQRRLENLFEKRVDVDWVARFVLGKHWRTASKEQQTTYLKNYRQFVIANYTGRLTNFKNQKVDIKNVRKDGDGEYLVSMEVVNPGEPNVFLDYRVRDTKSGYKIYDIVVEGVSMITTQRSEFNSAISRNDLDFLISALGKKANKS